MRRPEVGMIALAMLASACAFPTESPNWDMTWNLPLPDNGQSIGVKAVLPSGTDTVTPAPGAPLALRPQVASIPSISRTLGVQCPTCPTATAPKPKFTAPIASSTITLTSGTSLSSATLTTGSKIDILLTNGFQFDPINPPGSPGTPGTVTLTVSNGTTTLGTQTLTGGVTTIPANGTRAVTINLAGTINTSSPITISMTMDSPAGAATSPVAMNPNQLFTAAATATLNVSQATVVISAQSIPSSTDTLDFNIPDQVINRISNDAQNRGILFLTVTNPFTIGASPTITFQTPAGSQTPITPITKNITIPAATNATTPSVTTLPVALTGTELRSMAGKTLEVVFGGNTAAGTLTVKPTQAITFSQRVQLTMNLKEQP